MTEHADHDKVVHSNDAQLYWPTSAEGVTSTEETDSPNPVSIVLDRMHGRWLWALLLGLVLSPILAYLGWSVAPIKYKTEGRIEFSAQLPTLVGEIYETGRVEQEMESHKSAVSGGRVLYEALMDPKLAEFRGSATIAEFAPTIYSGISFYVPRRSNIVFVSWEGEDQKLGPAIVGSILRAYRKIYAPAPEVQLAETRAKLTELAKSAESEIDDINQQRQVLFENNPYGQLHVEPIIEANTTRLRELELERFEIVRHMNKVTDLARVEGRNPDPENSNDRILPTDEDLQLLEPLYAQTKLEVQALESRLQAIESRFSASHPTIRRIKIQLGASQQQLQSLKQGATSRWFQGPGKGLTYGALENQLNFVIDESNHLRTINTGLSEQKFNDDKLNDRLARAKIELASIENRLTQLDNEEDNVKEGRINVREDDVIIPLVPSKDRRGMMAAAGAIGGFAFSFLGFFMLGTFDKKTYGVRQLVDTKSSLRTLGVMPNMDEVDESPDTVNLATDCVHRIRARIESRRAPERGYALMITSPYQGDGKTTLAVSLGWSYAESGYRTVIVDADFIGRSMTHQFGRLREPGLREIVRSGKLNGEVVELGHPNLNLLGVGFDRRVSAANLNPGVLRRVIEALRAEFDIIIVDTGPMTASIEALPVASVSDGVVLALRRGRSRARVEECIADIRGVGADYLGIVLNYADQNDCLRYGSTSRTSMEVIAALEAGGSSESISTDEHPLLGRMPQGTDGDEANKG